MKVCFTNNELWREDYMPYGEKLIDNAVNDDLEGFTGHIDDSATGLTYMQARYYDPVMGRFLSNDPVGFLEHLKGAQGAQGFNRYAYVNNNPYRYTDPDGESSMGFSQAFTGTGITFVRNRSLRSRCSWEADEDGV